jgi:hypothetical protein
VKKSFNIQKNLHLKSKRHRTKPIQLRFILIFSEEIIQYSRTFAPQVQTSWNQDHSPLLVDQIHQEHNLKHPGSVDLIITKQNKLPSFIDR